MEKNNNTIIYILVFIIGILIGIVGMMLIQKNNDYKKVPNEVRTKEKKETKSTSKDNKPGKVKDELLKGCIYSSQNGKITCDDFDENVEYTYVEGFDKTINNKDFSRKFVLNNNGNKQSFEFYYEDGIQYLKADNKTLYQTNDTIFSVGILDNGLIVIHYSAYENQISNNNRMYFDKNLEFINSFSRTSEVEGHLLDKEFTYMGNEWCEKDVIRVYQIIKVTINSDGTIKESKDEILRTNDGCAGMT